MLLLKIGIFEITFGTVFTFVFGIAIAIAIMVLAYLMWTAKNLRSKDFKAISEIKIEGVKITTDMNKKQRLAALDKNRLNDNAKKSIEMITLYQDVLKDKKLRGGRNIYRYTAELSRSLIKGIATLYSPNSKYPEWQITIDETLDIAKYLSKKVSEILDYGGLKFIRKIKINSAINTWNFSETIIESNFVQGMKKYHVNKILFGIKVMINLVNPIYWIKKLVVNSSFNYVGSELCNAILQVVGAEAYNIYSRTYMRKENDLIES